MNKTPFEINISLQFSTGNHPILGSIAYLIMPKKKMVKIIKTAFEKELENYLKSFGFEQNRETELKIIK